MKKILTQPHYTQLLSSLQRTKHHATRIVESQQMGSSNKPNDIHKMLTNGGPHLLDVMYSRYLCTSMPCQLADIHSPEDV